MSVIIFSKYDGRPFRVSQENAKLMVSSGQFLTLNNRLGVNQHVEKTQLSDGEKEHGKGEVRHVDFKSRSESTSTQYHDQVLSESGKKTCLDSMKRGRGRPKVIKDSQ